MAFFLFQSGINIKEWALSREFLFVEGKFLLANNFLLFYEKVVKKYH
jgi:hypothetical protein